MEDDQSAVGAALKLATGCPHRVCLGNMGKRRTFPFAKSGAFAVREAGGDSGQRVTDPAQVSDERETGIDHTSINVSRLLR